MVLVLGGTHIKKSYQHLKSNQGTPDMLFPSAEAMLIIGSAALKRGEGVKAEEAQPVYVRDTVSWKKLPGKVKIAITISYEVTF